METTELQRFVAVQLPGHVQLFVTPWTAACQAPLSLTISWSLPKFMSIALWYHPTISSSVAPFSFCLQSFPASGSFPMSQVFSNESALCIRLPKYWSFSFSISPFNEYSGLISFKIDWFDSLAVQGTLKSLLQYHNSKASILQHSGFFMVQFSHFYMTTRKAIALAIQTFVGKVMSLLLNMLSNLS